MTPTGRCTRCSSAASAGSTTCTPARIEPADAIRRGSAVYTRRSEGVSGWVALAADVTASAPEEKEPLFSPSADKVFRHPTFYAIPDDVPHM